MVEKFIGDAVMAVWGTPAEPPKAPSAKLAISQPGCAASRYWTVQQTRHTPGRQSRPE
jgi:class 3 adenylate cyclase